jgi:AAA15 family ATPase/GTPase
MLSRLKVEHYKSLFDVEVKLEPLTVFIGPNGSGKSNICEALAIVSAVVKAIFVNQTVPVDEIMRIGFNSLNKKVVVVDDQIQSFFWHGQLDYLRFEIRSSPLDPSRVEVSQLRNHLYLGYNYNRQDFELSTLARLQKQGFQFSSNAKNFLISQNYPNSTLESDLKLVKIYDFSPSALNSSLGSSGVMSRAGQGLSNVLADILLSDRNSFDELEQRLSQLVPNIKRIVLPRNDQNQFSLELVDRYSDHRIPASEISDGTLRILAFLASLYQIETPSIICFEEIENGVHPWLLHKMIELLKLVSTEGINGKPVQVLITTHSPVLLDYVEPKQVRAVELDTEGKTQVHELPIESKAFQKALDAYDGALGELWFTNVFGGNPV